MASNVYPSQGIQTRLVRESTYGATPAVPVFKRINGFGVSLGATVEIDPYAPPGALIPTLPLVNDDYGEGDVEGRVDFNGLAYPLSGILGSPSILDLGSGAYQWGWSWDGRRPNRPVSYTIHNGFPESADVATGFLFNSLEISGGRADGFDVTGAGFSKALLAGQTMGGLTGEVQTLSATGSPASGTFAITVVQTGEKTAPIVFGASAAVVQAALEALGSINAGDIICAGGPVPTTPITMRYSGYFAGQDVALATVDNTLLTGGTYAIAATTPGADAVVDVPAVPAGAIYGNVYLDSSMASAGSTQLLHCYEMTMTFDDRMGRVRPINKSQSSDDVIDESDQEHTVALVLGRNAVADAQLAKLRAGTFIFPRIEWEGNVISGANKYLLQFDVSCFYQEVGAPDDTDNVSTKEFTARMGIDPVSQKAINVKLVNTLASL